MGDNLAGPSSLLPPGWTSHTSPTGRTYYHNASTGVSTYTLPVPKPPKREKPIAKTAIPGANGWFKITTNRQNVFYFHPETRTSEWLPPPAVAAAVREMEQAEASEKERIEREEQERVRQEQDRIRREKRERKRKAEEGVPITEFDAAKRARADDDGEEDEEEEEDADSIPSSDEDEDDKMNATPSAAPDAAPDTADATGTAAEDQDDDDDEEWQRQIAEQMAAEAEAEPEPSSPTPTVPAPSSVPDAPTSLEEQKSAFMTYLTSLNGTPHAINPMAPWDLELPKFSSHPSFLALPSREREDTFNEWCKLRIREKRAAKATTTSNSTVPTTSPSARSPSGEGAFLSLLQKEVRSTRTKFSDFKAAFGRTPAFASYGKGDGDREKLFRRHLVELGETKRRAAEAAEAAFLELLSDKLPGNYRGKVAAAKAGARSAGDEKDRVMGVWVEAKRTKGVVDDKRYDAVGSSTRRFELFGAWARGERRHSPSAVAGDAGQRSARESTDAAKAREKEEARARALAEREEKVRRERAHISRVNRSALSAANREEALLSFRQLLLDAVHSPHISYHSALPQLARDPRFDAPGLSDADRERLFAEHQVRLAAKEGERLGAVFSRYAKTLDAHADDVIALALHDAELSRPPLNVYTHDTARLHDAYARWDSERQKEAEVAFKQMLT